MKNSFRLLLAALLLVAAFTGRTSAGVSCSVPFNLSNGTTADASQVMANYNAILSCLANNTAESGANDSITSLVGLTTPISPASGGTTSFRGGTSTGTNAISIATVTPNSFTLTVGYRVVFVAGGSNTAATSLNVGGTGNENFYRMTPSGPQPMVGGEIVIGQLVEAMWDGTEYQMMSAPALGHAPGEVFDYAGSTCPAGSLETTGSSLVAQASFPTLFANIGTLWGSAAGGNFTIPDLRGRSTYSRDSGGSGRITVGGGNFDGTVVGHSGGTQSQSISQAMLPNVNFNVSGISLTNGAPTMSTNVNTGANSGAFTGISVGGVTNASTSWNGGGGLNINFSLTTNVSVATQGVAASGGSGAQVPTLSNAAIVLKCIKG